MDGTNRYNYYIYNNLSIVRIDNDHNAEIKNLKTNTWTKVEDAAVYRRIQQEGDLVTKEEAEEFYNEKRNKVSNG